MSIEPPSPVPTFAAVFAPSFAGKGPSFAGLMRGSPASSERKSGFGGTRSGFWGAGWLGTGCTSSAGGGRKPCWPRGLRTWRLTARRWSKTARSWSKTLSRLPLSKQLLGPGGSCQRSCCQRSCWGRWQLSTQLLSILRLASANVDVNAVTAQGRRQCSRWGRVQCGQ